MSVVAKTDPVQEAIARKLSGYGGVPPAEQAKMIRRAALAGARELLSNRLDAVRYLLDNAETDYRKVKILDLRTGEIAKVKLTPFGEHPHPKSRY